MLDTANSRIPSPFRYASGEIPRVGDVLELDRPDGRRHAVAGVDRGLLIVNVDGSLLDGLMPRHYRLNVPATVDRCVGKLGCILTDLNAVADSLAATLQRVGMLR
ncbi:MAG: hypothetical protein FJ033_16115 [Chloroflexi bacterium]|nr:hypothetical protein [Chloroflexota bacterium]